MQKLKEKSIFSLAGVEKRLVLPIIEKSVILKMHEELETEKSVFHNKKDESCLTGTYEAFLSVRDLILFRLDK